jgi:hypothetical protein
MMAKEVRIAFEQQVLLLALDDILPSKMLAPPLKATAKYKRIVASVAQLGLIEPLRSPVKRGVAIFFSTVISASTHCARKGQARLAASSPRTMRHSPTTSASIALLRSRSTT